MAVEGVCIAFDDPTLEPNPTWTRIDVDALVASYTIDRGRAFEFDQTDVGRAVITVNDRDGVLDPTNTSGPYYGLLEPLLQVAIGLWNPVAEEWSTIFRGYIEEFQYDVDPTQRFNRLTISCVDAFAILAGMEMTFADPIIWGDDPTGTDTAPGNIFYAAEPVDDRILGILGNAGWPVADLAIVFTGNVTVRDTVISPGETVLTALQEAADAEFPTVSNLYVDKIGRVVFHGRLAKFDPGGTAAGASPGAWTWTHWYAGDEARVAAAHSTAQIRSLAVNRGQSKVYNYATAYPMRELTAAELADQVVKDGTISPPTGSIGQYGIRTWSSPDLLTLSGLLDSTDDLEETKRFAEYIVANYKTPRNRVTAISFQSLPPDDYRAPYLWNFLANVDISDRVDLTETAKGESAGGFNLEPFYIEGVHYDVQPLNPDYQFVTLSLDLSPAAYFSENPWGDT